MADDERARPTPRAQLISRREALGALGALGLLLVAGCSSDSSSSSSPTTKPRATSTTAPPATTTSCVLAPEVTQGPFYLTDHPNTANLVQDRQGVPLALTLTVVDTKCAALANAKVDVWHCDASGVYGGVGNGPGAGGPGGPGGAGPGGGPGGGAPGQSGDFGAATRVNSATWLQGYQVTGNDGTVRFNTIYPGWYPGRAVHIHMKVFVGGNSVHTGQLFFPDALSASLFARSPYKGDPDTTNAADSIYRSAGSAALLAPAASGSGYTATAQLVVRD